MAFWVWIGGRHHLATLVVGLAQRKGGRLAVEADVTNGDVMKIQPMASVSAFVQAQLEGDHT